MVTESEEQEIKVLTRLKETVDKQREELRGIKREFSQKAIDCEAVSMRWSRSRTLLVCGLIYAVRHKCFDLE